MTPFERPATSPSTKDTRDLVRELLTRSAHGAPAQSSETRMGPREVAMIPRPVVMEGSVLAPSARGREDADERMALPMPPLTMQEMAERAKRPVPQPVPKDARDPEIYRLIYAGLELPAHVPVVVVGITSAIRGEGRSTIARLMAQTLSKEVGVRVTLVEADLERPTLLESHGREGEGGLAAVLREERHIDEVAGRWSPQYPDLYVIPAGDAGDEAARLLRRLVTHDPFRRPTGLQGLIIVDLPPIVSSSFGAIAAEVADAAVLVVRAGVTHSDTVREAVARMKNRPPQGVVLNAFRSPIPGWISGTRS